MTDGPLWKVLLGCARSLTARDVSPFTRVDLIQCVQRQRSEVGRSSLDPIIQGDDEERARRPSEPLRDPLPPSRSWTSCPRRGR